VAGEEITPQSPLIANHSDRKSMLRERRPRPLSYRGIQTALSEVVLRPDVRSISGHRQRSSGEKQHRAELTRGFSRFYDNKMEETGVDALYRAALRGNQAAIREAADRGVDLNEMLYGTENQKGYAAAIDALTVSPEIKRDVEQWRKARDNWTRTSGRRVASLEDESYKRYKSLVASGVLDPPPAFEKMPPIESNVRLADPSEVKAAKAKRRKILLERVSGRVPASVLDRISQENNDIHELEQIIRHGDNTTSNAKSLIIAKGSLVTELAYKYDIPHELVSLA
jgi:hypothetical protein